MVSQHHHQCSTILRFLRCSSNRISRRNRAHSQPNRRSLIFRIDYVELHFTPIECTLRAELNILKIWGQKLAGKSALSTSTLGLFDITILYEVKNVLVNLKI